MDSSNSDITNYGSIEIDYDSEETVEIVFDLLQRARECDKEAIEELETFLKRLSRKIRSDELDLSDIEIFIDAEEELNQIVNDVDWRTVPVGSGATRCVELLLIIQKYLVPFNENFELVLATNPFIPEQVVKKLLKSTYAWEEDGTTQALARATSDPLVLKRLAKSRENSTRFEVAANPLTPPEILKQLAKDVEISDSLWYSNNGLESFIQVAVVRNPNTPIEVLKGFLTDRYYFTEEDFVASHGWSLVSAKGLTELREFLAKEARTRLTV